MGWLIECYVFININFIYKFDKNFRIKFEKYWERLIGYEK